MQNDASCRTPRDGMLDLYRRSRVVKKRLWCLVTQLLLIAKLIRLPVPGMPRYEFSIYIRYVVNILDCVLEVQSNA